MGANSSSDAESAFKSVPIGAGSWAFLLGAVVAGLLSLTAALRRFQGRSNVVGVAVIGVLGAVLLVLVPDAQLLRMLGYAPIFLVGAPFGWPPLSYFYNVTWTVVFQLISVVGGLLLAATALAWRRRARRACTSCGRMALPARWTTPAGAATWGRWATVAAVFVPAIYAIDRLAWVVGIPLGITPEFLDELRSSGLIWSAFGLGTFAAIGAVLTFGLIQRWGEVFPRWMFGLAGKRVPPMLAEIPATRVAILVTSASIPLAIGVGGTGDIADGLGWMHTLLMAAFPLWAFPRRGRPWPITFAAEGPARAATAPDSLPRSE